MCANRYATRARPVTAMTVFLPIVDAQNRPTGRCFCGGAAISVDTRLTLGVHRPEGKQKFGLVRIGWAYADAPARLLRGRRRHAALHPGGRTRARRAAVAVAADPSAGTRRRRRALPPHTGKSLADRGRRDAAAVRTAHP